MAKNLMAKIIDKADLYAKSYNSKACQHRPAARVVVATVSDVHPGKIRRGGASPTPGRAPGLWWWLRSVLPTGTACEFSAGFLGWSWFRQNGVVSSQENAGMVPNPAHQPSSGC